MNFDELYPGRFLKAGLIPNGKANYTITSVAKEQIEGERGLEDKVVVQFEETALQLVLPKVNAVAIRAMFGSNVQDWIGKRVTLYATTDIMPFPKRRNEPCIRVFGSPDIREEVTCEWQPPKRRKLIQKLQPTGYFTAAWNSIKQGTAEQMPAMRNRVEQLLSQGELKPEEAAQLVAAIEAKV